MSIEKIYERVMKNEIGRKLHANPIIYHICHFIVGVEEFIRLKYRTIKQYVSTLPRQFGYIDKRYLNIKSMKNLYEGKRCFITCTGPSLTIEDLESLKDEYVFGMNSICLIHDKTDWTPTFFGIQDDKVFDKVKNTLLTTNNGIVFAPYYYKKHYNTPDDWVYFPMCGSYHIFEARFLKWYFTKFSSDCYVKVYDGFSITYSLMEIAIYLGFKEIYLLGADCSYLGNKKNFISHGHVSGNLSTATDRLLNSYGTVKKYADKNGIKIFNATRGGCLELFPRVNLEDVLRTSNGTI